MDVFEEWGPQGLLASCHPALITATSSGPWSPCFCPPLNLFSTSSKVTPLIHTSDSAHLCFSFRSNEKPSLIMLYKALHGLAPVTSLQLSPRSLGCSHAGSRRSRKLPPSGLCTGCSLGLQRPPPRIRGCPLTQQARLGAFS